MLVSASSRTCSVQLFEFLGQLKRILWQNDKCTTTVDIDKLMVFIQSVAEIDKKISTLTSDVLDQ